MLITCFWKGQERIIQQFIIAKIFLNNNEFLYIISLYNPPRRNYPHTSNNFWTDFLSGCEQYSSVLICSDVNGKSPLWSSTQTRADVKGAKIESATSYTNWVILNDGHPTWSSQDIISTSVLDITLASSDIALKGAWNVSNFNVGSDHYPIYIKININFNNRIPCRSRLFLKNINWSLFTDLCLEALGGFQIFENNVHQTYDSFINLITTALTSSHTKINSSNKLICKPPTPWWDDDCSEEFRKKKNAFRDYLKYLCTDKASHVSFCL